jgi:membrane protein YdbS with pleckstrin-like domain
MAPPGSPKPRMLKAAYLSDQEFLLEETRASRLLYFPGPVLWTVVFAVLTYLSWAPTAGLVHVTAYANALGWLGSVTGLGAANVERSVAVVFLILVLVGLAWFGVRYLRWIRTVYAVTNRRVLIQRGILGRDFDEIPVTQVRGVDVSQSVGQRILGYGTIRVSSEGGSSHLGNEDWRGIPKPFRFQKLVEDATAAIQSGGSVRPGGPR